MTLVKTQYKNNNNKFLAIVEDFKTSRNYLKNCKHTALIHKAITIYVTS